MHRTLALALLLVGCRKQAAIDATVAGELTGMYSQIGAIRADSTATTLSGNFNRASTLVIKTTGDGAYDVTVDGCVLHLVDDNQETKRLDRAAPCILDLGTLDKALGTDGKAKLEWTSAVLTTRPPVSLVLTARGPSANGGTPMQLDVSFAAK